MKARPKRSFILGLDGAVPQLVERFAAEGRMPNLSKLIQRGCFAHALPVLPTHTPVNWTTIGTGAWPGTHGITGFSINDRTKELTNLASSADSEQVRAQFLWQAAEQVGKKSILLKWGGPNFPVTVKDGVQVDGCFCVCCEHELAGPARFGTSHQPSSTRIELAPADDWPHVPPSNRPPLATEIVVGKQETATVTVHLLCVAESSHYDTLLLFRAKGGAELLASVQARQWSDWVTLDFSGRKGTFRAKVLDLAADGSALEVYVSQIMPHTGWTYPEDVARDLTENVGPFIQRPGYNQRGTIYSAWADMETMLEEIEYQHEWFAKAAKHLCENYEHDLFFLHTHAPDYIQDAVMPEAEPLTADSPEQSAEYLELVAKVYQSCDRTVGRIVDDVTTEDDLVCVVSDHGCVGYHADLQAPQMIKKILEDNGFLMYKGSEREAHVSSKPSRGHSAIDWSRTKAIWHDTMYIYMNVKGRQPNGVVEPDEYEQTRSDIIQALLDYKDPRLGRCPFSLVLRREDAGMLGLWGDRVGDIIVCCLPGGNYGEGHGNLLPTAIYGLSSLQATLILAGPGVRTGHKISRPVWLTDVAPTVAHLMQIPPPPTMEGAVLHEALLPSPTVFPARRIRRGRVPSVPAKAMDRSPWPGSRATRGRSTSGPLVLQRSSQRGKRSAGRAR